VVRRGSREYTIPFASRSYCRLRGRSRHEEDQFASAGPSRGRAERLVAHQVEPLRELGWTIAHNVPREGGGNLDHFLSGPTGAYAIETKSGKYRAADRGQTISNAVWAKEKFGVRFVTAVLCVETNPPEEPRRELHGQSECWVLGPAQLHDWLLAYRWTPRRPVA
jgi:hypothetical protein